MKKTLKVDSETSRLNELMFELMRLMKQQMSKDGYNPSFYLHLETLRFLTEAGEPDMQDIAQYLRISAPSATQLVDALVREKFAVRIPDANDRRRVLIGITSAGRRMTAKAARWREAAFARVAAPLTAADRRELIRILSVITNRS